MVRKAYSPSVSHVGCSLPTGSKCQQVTSVLPSFVWEQSLDIFIIGGSILILMLACWECKKVLFQGKKACHHSVLGLCYRMSIVGKCWRIISVLPSLVQEQFFQVFILISLLACWKSFSSGKKACNHCLSGELISCTWEVNTTNHFYSVLCCVGAILGCINYWRLYPHSAACLQKYWKGFFPGKANMESQCLNCRL